MNLLTDILLGPITLPSKGFLYVFNKVKDQADAEMNDPARIRADLVVLQQRLDAGQMTLESYEAAEDEMLLRLDAIEQRRMAEEAEQRPSAVVTASPRRHRRRR